MALEHDINPRGAFARVRHPTRREYREWARVLWLDVLAGAAGVGLLFLLLVARRAPR